MTIALKVRYVLYMFAFYTFPFIARCTWHWLSLYKAIKGRDGHTRSASCGCALSCTRLEIKSFILTRRGFDAIRRPIISIMVEVIPYHFLVRVVLGHDLFFQRVGLYDARNGNRHHGVYGVSWSIAVYIYRPSLIPHILYRIYGVTCIQTLLYYQNYRDDRLSLKAMVV